MDPYLYYTVKRLLQLLKKKPCFSSEKAAHHVLKPTASMQTLKLFITKVVFGHF